VYATGLGRGLYRIDPTNVAANQLPLGDPFNACGHLAINGPMAVATAASPGASTELYTSIVQVPLPAGTQRPAPITVQPGRDGFAIYGTDDGAQTNTLYVATGPDASQFKHIRAFTLPGGAPVQAAGASVDLTVLNTGLSMAVAPNPATLLVTLADDFSLRVVDLKTNTWAVNNVLPLQVAPVSVAVDPKSNTVYALNYASNTVSTITGTSNRLSATNDTTKELLPTLARYRREAIEAFSDLLAGTAEYLKDCFCEHLLVDCPSCNDRNRKLYLGGVKIRKGEVYQICNFTKRHYVKSFPTLGYWLSVVPILPMFGWLIRELCCMVLPEIGARYKAPAYSPTVAPGATKDPSWASVLQQALANSQGQDFMSRLSALLARGSILGQVGKEVVTNPTVVTLPALGTSARGSGATTTGNTAAGGTAIVNRSADQVQTELRGANVLVKRMDYAPGSVNLVAAAIDTFRDPPPGSQVTLYEDNGVVKYYTIDTNPAHTELTTQVADLSGQLATSDTQLRELQLQLQVVLSQQTALQQAQAQQAVTITNLHQLVNLRNPTTGGDVPPISRTGGGPD
jgi:hypothetical protein